MRYEFIEFPTGTLCKVYDYTLDTVKEMEAKGWTLYGTYYSFLSFQKDK